MQELSEVSDMEVIEETGKVNFASIIDLLKEEWPKDWGTISDEKMIEDFEKTANDQFDVNKYLSDNGKIIGWYRYSAWPREKDNIENAHTFDIVIDPNYQGRGLGKMMMEDMILDCKKKGFKKLMSRTIEGNHQSYRLHEKTGFKMAFRKGIDIVWEIDLL